MLTDREDTIRVSGDDNREHTIPGVSAGSLRMLQKPTSMSPVSLAVFEKTTWNPCMPWQVGK